MLHCALLEWVVREVAASGQILDPASVPHTDFYEGPKAKAFVPTEPLPKDLPDNAHVLIINVWKPLIGALDHVKQYPLGFLVSYRLYCKACLELGVCSGAT